MRTPKKRSYPETLTVGDDEWRLVFKKLIGKSKKTLGLCDPDSKTLSIKTRQTKEETLKTIIHEAVHAAEESYEFELDHDHVYLLEQAIFDFIIDNF